MFRDILSSRSLIIGLVFFAVIVTSSLLYNRHVRRVTQEELARTQQIVQPHFTPLTRKPTDIQLSLIHVNPLSDVPILDTLMSFAYVRRHASFPLASHLAVSSNAVRVGYTVVRFNRVRIELTFYHYSLKRTHNLGLDGGPNFRWQYTTM